MSSLHTFAKNIHIFLVMGLSIFTAAAIILGEWLDLYQAAWWWDDMLHGVAGLLIGFAGLLGIYFFNSRYSMALKPLFVAIFVFCFAMTVSALWEVFEFTMDACFHTTMQVWNLPPDHVKMIGKVYQGPGLRDTMSDLIVASIGSFIAACFSFFFYEKEKDTLLHTMRKTFPWIRHRKR